ncbi:G-type lectin S-receptor-like serine/threonine-protein kinase B120 isoform X2 [Neltuma alba]|uniref:G-type lectin S-receptor-like serine/threonine-protein kinase B120 isoform X2 n=1 Tax=Neltuma alba TaxID=207710 RepID=UPI0010A360E0|nr:G-type lectin S-receptor-like serine/threonine-protein kinase B120 isoform X2 [Prosopis alba]
MESAHTLPLFPLSFVTFFILCFLALFSHAAIFNSITQGQLIRDGDTVVSNGLNFELGFFSPQDSPVRYVGIWYSVPGPSVIWVANRGNPIKDKEGAITISRDGNLVILDGQNNTVWSSNVSIPIPRNKSKAFLRDDGNLILSSSPTNRKLWKSFEHPTDTFLPGMIVPVNETMGEVRTFVSWKSADNPSPGNYTMGLDPRAALQIVIWEGSKRRWRSGYWDGRIFTGVSNMTSSYLYGFRLNVNDDQTRYLTYNPLNSSEKVRFQIGWDGTERELIWDEGERKWTTVEREPYNDCDLYNKCGNFGVCCLSTSPICNCLKGFEPKDWDQWQKGNWSGGCKRRTPLKNEIKASNGTDKNVKDDGFLMIRCMKLPDFVNLVADRNSGIDTTKENCENRCVSDSNCTAYAYVIGIGCMIWHGELVDIDHFGKGGNTLFIRLAASELGNRSKKTEIMIIASVVAGVICLGLCVWLAYIFQRKSKGGKNDNVPIFVTNKSRDSSVDVSGSTEFSLEGNQLSGPELPFFNFNCIAIATNNFSEENKLGEGGFGPVYKGKLPGGEEIAVKRLSRCSGQGLEEFKNEMVLIARLQHRNLVRLWGCSIQEEEKLLVYEYLPNKSLDCYLFDPVEQKKLDWKKRFEIIEGIARGILYLHRDSRLRIIHRDLKASNILLDENMNPKISDFGLARIFGGNQNEANTNRVVGTYGYMAPEYAMEGLFSVKSDVYSFGVLLLEIVTGRKNTSFRDKDGPSLIGYAWRLWNEERGMELVDPKIRDSTPRRKALRWIQIGMLCVQDSAGHRPTMSTVVLMLESETMALPCPRQPLICSSSEDEHVHMDGPLDASSNGLTITVDLVR